MWGLLFDYLFEHEVHVSTVCFVFYYDFYSARTDSFDQKKQYLQSLLQDSDCFYFK